MEQQQTRGQVIVELLIAFGLAAILIPALLTGLIGAQTGKVQQEQRILAVGLLREGEEAVRSVRDIGWDNIKYNGDYYAKVVGSSWVLTTNVNDGILGDFTRTINIADISPSDPSVKKITITVTWGSGFIPSSTGSTVYITRWKNTSLTDSGTVQPQGQGFGDWCKPALALTNINLNRQGHPTSLRAKETPNAVDGNRILAGTGANSSGPAFSNLKLLGDNPPVVTNLGDYNGSPQVKVNGLIGDDHYAFIATDSKGVEFLDLTTNPISEIGSFNPSGMKPVNDVYVVGNTGYAVTSDKFYIFGISPDRKTSTPSGTLALSSGVKVVVDPSNLYAYVANPDLAGQLKIIDVHSHPSNLTSADVKNVQVGGAAGRDVFITANATRAYLATAVSATQPEFFIINIQDPTNPSVFQDSGTDKATYDTGEMDPYGLTKVTDNRMIMVGVNGNEYQVFNVADDKVTFCPNHAAGTDYLNVDTGVYAISSILQTNVHAYSYIATGDAGAELKIIEGGPGGGGNGSNGLFESATLPIPDPGHDVAFNSFTATVDPDLSYKISIKPGINGSCSGVTFSDSDFTSFIPGPLPLGTLGAGYANPGECMRYRVYDSGDSTKSFTVTFNYSP